MDKKDTKSHMEFRYTKRWFSYFDLLGFSSFVRSKSLTNVLRIYEEALTSIVKETNQKQSPSLSYSWFSDTFIIFTRGESIEEFALIEGASRLFFQKLILKEIPVRGALSYGDLYTQKKKDIFLGEALIDAYEYGENQNWLNFLITPSAYDALLDLDFPMEKSAHYRRVNQDDVITHPKNENVFAFAFNNGSVNNINPFLTALNSMKEQSPNSVHEKYDYTIQFINKHAWVN